MSLSAHTDNSSTDLASTGLASTDLASTGDETSGTLATERHSLRARLTGVLLLCAAAAVITPAALGAQRARAPRAKRVASVINLITPLGTQSPLNSGGNVVLAFALTDQRGRDAFVDVEYGFDRDGSGEIDEHEFERATHSTADPRNTFHRRAFRRGSPRIIWSSAPGAGARHAFSWDADKQLESVHLPTQTFQRTPTGRLINDADRPGEFLRADLPGVVMRVRARRGRGRLSRTDWVYTEAFEWDSSSPPSLSVNGSTPGAVALIEYTVADRDATAATQGAVAFDFARLPDGASPSDVDLDTLFWQPCTQLDGAGDGEVNLPFSAAGATLSFAWDALDDTLGNPGEYVIRGRAFDGDHVSTQAISDTALSLFR